MSDGGSDDSLDSSAGLDRARPEERGMGRLRPPRRSKSEGPPARHLLFQSEYRLRYWKCDPRCYGVIGGGVGGGGELVGGEEGGGGGLGKRQGAADRKALHEASEQRAQRGEKREEEMMTASYPPPAPGHPTRISTEYRLQFAWPRASDVVAAAAATSTTPAGVVTKRGGTEDGGGPRKSLSMGAIRPASHLLMAPVHKKKTEEREDEEGASELEPLVGPDSEAGGGGENMPDELRGEEKIQLEEALSKEEKFRRRKEFKTEYKKKFRPFSQYEYVEGRFQKKKDGTENMGTSCGIIGPSPLIEPPPLIPSTIPTEGSISSHFPLQDDEGNSWYREVLELRKKAGEYKHRGWGTELVPQHIAQLYNKQMALWEQVSRRSSLSALSLASTTPRPISKEEKEKENNKKSSPVKGSSSMAPYVQPPATMEIESEKKKVDKSEEKKDFPRSRKEYLIRHHLERTTGAIDGALLPSPTREKLEPVLPRRKEEDVSIKSPPKASPKSSPRSARSHSVGPAAESRSPKRQPRVGSQGSQCSPAQVPTASANISHPPSHKTPPAVGPSQSERRPRPIVDIADTKIIDKDDSSVPLQSTALSQSPPVESTAEPAAAPEKSALEETQPLSHMNGEGSWEDDVISSHLDEPLVKSPPEPTRVKSPEQILMRSPEPVNWTVPLDTGKTFTVTQNVLEAMPNVKLYRGELSRPHSEAKVWTPPGPSSLSGESQLIKEQPRVPSESPAQVDQMPGWKSPVSEPFTSSETSNLKSVNGLEETNDNEAAIEEDGVKRISETIEVENASLKSCLPLSESPKKQSVTPECEKVVAGTTLKCLEDPSFIFENQPPRGPVPEEVSHVAYRVLEAPGVPSDVLYQPTETEEAPIVQPAPSTTSQGQPIGSSMPTAVVGAGPSAGPYRILEAPEIPIQESPTKALPPLVSPSTGRSLASDVLEKARTRFDKFWGKGKDSDREGKV